VFTTIITNLHCQSDPTKYMYSKQAQPTARNNIQYKLRAAAIKV